MIDRRPVQQAHERFYVEQFLDWFNQVYRSNFQVISEPNPPEAVIRSNRTTRWVEVSTAFWSRKYAWNLYSYATPDEKHKPIDKGPFQSMDESFVNRFVSVVRKKLEKKSYIPLRNQYGPGYLVIPVKHPWFDKHTVVLMKNTWAERSINNLGCFRSIYIAFPSLNNIRFLRWSAK